MTLITVHLEVSCPLRFTPATNSLAHTSQLRDGGLILYLSRIRIFVTYPRRTHREHTDNSIIEATLIPWIAGLSRPTNIYCDTLKYISKWTSGRSGFKGLLIIDTMPV